ncbi:MAG: hypothetical protein IJV50_05120 [Lachnospiraceae bacterium]|nr:hypothetical protein [Lachnospiraceae bacterium]
MKKQVWIWIMCLACLSACGKDKGTSETEESGATVVSEQEAQSNETLTDGLLETTQQISEETETDAEKEQTVREGQAVTEDQTVTETESSSAGQEASTGAESKAVETVVPEPVYPEETNPLVPDGIQLPLVPVQ